MLSKTKKRIIALASLVMVTMTAFSVAYTYAAYVNQEANEQDTVIDINYTKYFNGGNGTQQTPYLIANSDQLRNFSYLVNMGVFMPTDYFALSNDIAYDYSTSKKPLIPIGNFHNPFYSQFNGQGNSIDNLVVYGKDLADVGLFGFAANSSKIENFSLNSPTVCSKRTNPGQFTYATMDNNPMRAKISEDLCKSVALTEDTTVKLTNGTSGMTTFSITLPTLPDGYVAAIQLSEKTGYIIENGSPTSFKLAAYTTERYVTLEVFAIGMVTLPDGTNRLSRFVLERFKLFCALDNGTQYIAIHKFDPRRYKKIMYPGADFTQNNSGSYDWDRPNHLLYVGIVAGNMEGMADKILVYKPRLFVDGGPFQSNTYLFGRQIDDDNKAPLAKESLDFSKLPYEFDLGKQRYKEDSSSYNYEDYQNGVNQFGAVAGNVTLQNIYTTNKQPGLISKNSEDSFKIYAARNFVHPYPGEGSRQGTVKLVNHNIKLRDTDTTLTNANFLSFSGDLGAKMIGYQGWRKGVPITSVQNGFQFWATSEEKGFLAQLVSGNAGKFVLTFDIDYLFYDEHFTPGQTNKSNKEFIMRATNKQKDESLTTYRYQNPNNNHVSPNNDQLYDWNKVLFNEKHGDNSNYIYPSAHVLPDKDPNNPNPMEFAPEHISGNMQDAVSTTEQKIKNKRIAVNVEIAKGDTSGLESIFSKKTPVIIFGMGNKDPNIAGEWQLDILRMNILISNKDGDFAGTMLNVDFSEGYVNTVTQTALDTKTNSRIETSLFVKSGEKVGNSANGIPADNAAPAIKVNDLVNAGCGKYLMEATRRGNDVSIKYSLANQYINTNPYTITLPHETFSQVDVTLTKDTGGTLVWPSDLV